MARLPLPEHIVVCVSERERKRERKCVYMFPIYLREPEHIIVAARVVLPVLATIRVGGIQQALGELPLRSPLRPAMPTHLGHIPLLLNVPPGARTAVTQRLTWDTY